jgi:hypothetical protein
LGRDGRRREHVKMMDVIDTSWDGRKVDILNEILFDQATIGTRGPQAEDVFSIHVPRCS